MNYYKFNIGDYAAATRHLTMIEHGAYRLLLDLYYTTEQPIPADLKAAARKAGARSSEEVAAVEVVLPEFFKLTEAGWVHARCETEIAAYHQKAVTNRVVGTRGGRPKKETQTVSAGNPEITQTVSEINPQETLTTNQEPLTNNQSPPYPQTGESEPENPTQPENQNPAETQHPTPQALAAMAMRRAGLSAANPGSPQLAALVLAGATPEVFAAAAAEAVQRGKGFNYALSIVEGQLAKAAQIAQLGRVDMQPAINPRLAGAI